MFNITEREERELRDIMSFATLIRSIVVRVRASNRPLEDLEGVYLQITQDCAEVVDRLCEVNKSVVMREATRRSVC